MLLVQRYKDKGTRSKEPKEQRNQRIKELKGELALKKRYLSKVALYTVFLVSKASS